MKIDYKKKVMLSSEDCNQKRVEFMVEGSKLQLWSDLLATKQFLENKKSELEDAKTEYPLDTEAIVRLMCEIESLEDGIKKLEKLQKEFGFDAK